MKSFLRTAPALIALSLAAVGAHAATPGYVDIGKFKPTEGCQFVEVNLHAPLLKFASMFVDSDWFTGRSLGDRRSMVAKLVRVHIFGLLETRSESGGWSGKDRHELASILRAVLASAEGSLEPFSRADCRVANAILDPEFPQERLMELARARRAFLMPTTFLPMRIKAAMTPESPLRFLPAAALLR